VRNPRTKLMFRPPEFVCDGSPPVLSGSVRGSNRDASPWVDGAGRLKVIPALTNTRAPNLIDRCMPNNLLPVEREWAAKRCTSQESLENKVKRD